MTRPDYTEFDAELVRLIGSGSRVFSALCSSTKLRELARPFVSPSGAEDRIIDRRLQALRKAGRIHYGTRTGWRLIKGAA